MKLWIVLLAGVFLLLLGQGLVRENAVNKECQRLGRAGGGINPLTNESWCWAHPYVPNTVSLDDLRRGR